MLTENSLTEALTDYTGHNFKHGDIGEGIQQYILNKMFIFICVILHLIYDCSIPISNTGLCILPSAIFIFLPKPFHQP